MKSEFPGFGDGRVEIENVKEAGVGADQITPNHLGGEQLLAPLFPNGE
ncbi:MAG TPA: hypothetical protein VGE89_01370 [Bryobacteraceae bacterium]|jgi:hypothetical protein